MRRLNIVENALTRTNNQVDAVVASNDGTARGVVQALEGQKLAGKVLVSGQDADLASLKLIVEGKQTMTVYKSIQPLANGAVDAAIKLARGENLETTDTIDNGFKKVPAILLEPIAVDRNNLLDTVVKDGYHKLEEICAGLATGKMPAPAIGRFEFKFRVSRLRFRDSSFRKIEIVLSEITGIEITFKLKPFLTPL